MNKNTKPKQYKDPAPGPINWFPGHMAKTRRMITENLCNVDLIIEVLDARIPLSSRNPELPKLTAGKPRLVVLNKSSLADPGITKQWIERLSSPEVGCIAVDCITGEGFSGILPAVREILKEKQEKYESKGMIGRRFRAMILGIPNVGKSTLINRLVGNKKAKAENRPGVTTDKAWYSTSIGIDLMDMPGLLWPRFDERITGENLAITGAIKDAILDTEEIATCLCGRLRRFYPSLLLTRYPIAQTVEELADASDFDILSLIGKKRGFLVSGGETDTLRAATMVIDEFRAGKIGRMTLDRVRSGRNESKTAAD